MGAAQAPPLSPSSPQLPHAAQGRWRRTSLTPDACRLPRSRGEGEGSVAWLPQLRPAPHRRRRCRTCGVRSSSPELRTSCGRAADVLRTCCGRAADVLWMCCGCAAEVLQCTLSPGGNPSRIHKLPKRGREKPQRGRTTQQSTAARTVLLHNHHSHQQHPMLMPHHDINPSSLSSTDSGCCWLYGRRESSRQRPGIAKAGKQHDTLRDEHRPWPAISDNASVRSVEPNRVDVDHAHAMGTLLARLLTFHARILSPVDPACLHDTNMRASHPRSHQRGSSLLCGLTRGSILCRSPVLDL